MKILQALFFPPEQPGGVSSMVPYIRERFYKMGWGMELFSLPKRIRGKGSEDWTFTTFDSQMFTGNKIVDKYIQTIKDYYWFAQMRLRHSSYDVIHAHHPIAAIAMKRLFPDTPVLMTIHSSFERELILNRAITVGGHEYQFLTSLYRELEAHTDQLMTVSQSFHTYITPFIEYPDRVRIITNGFDPKRFRPIEHDNTVPQIVTLCRLVPAKGLDVLFKALSDLKHRGQSFVLHLIGDGPMRTELEQLAIDLDIYEETIFYGYMLHPEELMPFFDVFVLPSRAEAFGNVFAEAALCGLALVGTDVGGIAEQVQHEVNGLLVPVDNDAALSLTLQQVISDNNLRHKLAKSAYETAKKRFSITRAISELKGIYQSYQHNG